MPGLRLFFTLCEKELGLIIQEAASSESAQNMLTLRLSKELSSKGVTVCAIHPGLFAKKTDYPLHLGVTEAGSKMPGAIKSSMGMGILLSEGIQFL